MYVPQQSVVTTEGHKLRLLNSTSFSGTKLILQMQTTELVIGSQSICDLILLNSRSKIFNHDRRSIIKFTEDEVYTKILTHCSGYIATCITFQRRFQE